MNWENIKEFNFTYAIPGGAWLKDGKNCEWFSYSVMDAKMGKDWVNTQLRKQGMFTGCWIDVVPAQRPTVHNYSNS